jgi:hypothetical protein
MTHARISTAAVPHPEWTDNLLSLNPMRMAMCLAEKAIVWLAVLLGMVFTLTAVAHAGLERVGPTDPKNGYPAWYQDKTGLAVEFCSPLNQAELDGGYCLLLAGDTVAPEVFPTQFFDEHFYWAGNALIDFALPNGTASRAKLVLALEGAFAQGPVVSGDQIVFGRIRVDVRNLPFAGTYTVFHPYGVWTFDNQAAGDRLFFTEDIGFNCPAGQFDCVLASSLGPFLLASNVPGGPELPAFAGPAGRLYVADPGRVGPVTGSPRPAFRGSDGLLHNPNTFRIEGPNGFAIETTDFSLMGRVMTDAIPGRVTVDRAAYAASTAGVKLDVFATGFPTTQGRLPAAPKPPLVTPVLSYLNAACGIGANGTRTAPAGGTETPMAVAGVHYWGQNAPAAIPGEVCVKDAAARNANGQVVPAFYSGLVTDEITITQALYDPGTGILTVKATSSDQAAPTLLSVAGYGNLVNGQYVSPAVAAPPAKVTVVSSNGGLRELPVTTGTGGGAAPSPTIPLAVNDAVTTNEDTPVTINVLANDTLNGGAIPAGAIVTITSAPRLGTAQVVGTAIAYAPSLNANGGDALGYTVTVNGAVSNPAAVAVTILPVNDAPVAVNDATNAVAGRVNSVNVLANDTDPDGQADLQAAVIVTGSAPLGIAAGAVHAGGSVSFTPNQAGTFTFTYRARDAAGSLSNPATVTVTVTGAEQITATATFRTDKRRWIVGGTDSVIGGQTLTIAYNNGTFLNGSSAAGTVIGTAVVDAAGNFLLDFVGAGGVQDPTNTTVFRPQALPTSVRIASPLGGATVVGITVRR